jgi:hypothetical protein
MTKAATRPKANNGQRRQKPVSDKPAAKPAAAKQGRVMTIRSRRERFNRAGLTFTNTTPTTVREDEVGTERFDRILAEPQLRCEMCEGD